MDRSGSRRWETLWEEPWTSIPEMPVGTMGLQSAIELIIEMLEPTWVSPSPPATLRGAEFINMQLGTPTALVRAAAIRKVACNWLTEHLLTAALRVIRDGGGVAGFWEYDREFLRRTDTNSRFINDSLFDPAPGKKYRLDNRAIFMALLDAEFSQAGGVACKVPDDTSKKAEEVAAGGAPNDPATGLREAPDTVVNGAITQVYDDAEAQKEKAPNINQISRPVQVILETKGYKSSGSRIRWLAEFDHHARRRRKPGKTLASERRRAEKADLSE